MPYILCVSAIPCTLPLLLAIFKDEAQYSSVQLHVDTSHQDEPKFLTPTGSLLSESQSTSTQSIASTSIEFLSHRPQRKMLHHERSDYKTATNNNEILHYLPSPQSTQLPLEQFKRRISPPLHFSTLLPFPLPFRTFETRPFLARRGCFAAGLATTGAPSSVSISSL